MYSFLPKSSYLFILVILKQWYYFYRNERVNTDNCVVSTCKHKRLFIEAWMHLPVVLYGGINTNAIFLPVRSVIWDDIRARNGL